MFYKLLNLVSSSPIIIEGVKFQEFKIFYVKRNFFIFQGGGSGWGVLEFHRISIYRETLFA